MATDRFTKSPASRKRMSELISRIGKDESQDAGDLLTDEALEDLPELAKRKRGITPREVSEGVAFREEPLVKEVPEGVEYRTEDSAGGAARPLGEIGGYGRVDEEAFSKMLDEAEPFSFEDEKKLVAQQVADPRNYGSWDGGGGYSYTHVTDDPDNPYIMVKKADRSGARRVVPGTKGIGGSDIYGRILAEKQMLDLDPKVAKAFYDNLPEGQREAIEAAGNVDVPAEDKGSFPGAGKGPLEETYTFDAGGEKADDAGEIPVDLQRPPKTSEAGEPLPKPAESQKAKEEGARGTVSAPARLVAEAAKYGVDLANPSKEDQGLVAGLRLAVAAPSAMVLEVLEENGAPPGLLDYVKNVYLEEAAPESGEEDFPVRRADFAADEAKRPFESGARMDTNRPPADAGPTRVSVEREPGQYTFANPPEEKSGAAKVEPRRGPATASPEDLEFFQGIGEAADITPAGGDPRVPTVEGQLTPEDLPLAANITPPPAGTAMVEPRRGDLDTSPDSVRAELKERHKTTAKDFMTSVGPLSRKVPDAVKAEGEEATELYILSEYVRENGGKPEDIELALYFAEEGDTYQLLEVLDSLPANVVARAARTGGM